MIDTPENTRPRRRPVTEIYEEILLSPEFIDEIDRGIAAAKERGDIAVVREMTRRREKLAQLRELIARKMQNY